jgi:hypothetical protein
MSLFNKRLPNVKNSFLNALILVSVLAFPFVGLAQGVQHPRRVMSITTNDLRQAIIAVGPKVCWSLYEISRIESVCTPSGHCAKVLSAKPNRNSLLPDGWLFHLSEPIVAVSDLFGDPADFDRELTEMGRDLQLNNLVQQIVYRLQSKKMFASGGSLNKRSKVDDKPKPAVWYDESASKWSMEFGTAVTAGIWSVSLSEKIVFMYGGSLRFGFRFQDKLESHYSADCITGMFSAIWDLIRGNQYGLDLRLHWMREADHNRFLIGLQPLSRYVSKPNTEFARWRFPGLLSIVVPEGGLIVDGQSNLGGYIRFVAPVSVLLTTNVGLELRLSTGIMFEEETSFFWSGQVGLFIRN